MNDIINFFETSQIEYLNKKDKSYLKNTSQFFTPYDTACKMISTIDFNNYKNSKSLRILEPSSGCGILIASIVMHIVINYNHIKEIYVDAYEYDEDVCKILSNNLVNLSEYIYNVYNVTLKFHIINKNFILANANAWNEEENSNIYDIIISNPPYKKINKSSEESVIMNDIIYGQPNIYTLFIAMSLKLLKKNGTYIVLSPRNYLSGEYSKKLRTYIFSKFSLTHIHLFEKRSMFKSVNQEVIISTFVNNKFHDNVNISFNGSSNFSVPFDDIILDKNSYSLIVPKTSKDIALSKCINSLQYTLNDLGLKISVGPIVQFRNIEDIRKDVYSEQFAPLLVTADIQPNNTLQYFSRENKRKTHNKSILSTNKYLVNNSNYVIIRKVTAKDDIDLIVASVLSKDYFNHDFIGLDNNLLYIHKIDRTDIDLDICYGIYAFINSLQFKNFYFLINGTHTINVTDFNNIKFPELNLLKQLGSYIRLNKNFSEKYCSDLFNKYLIK